PCIPAERPNACTVAPRLPDLFRLCCRRFFWQTKPFQMPGAGSMGPRTNNRNAGPRKGSHARCPRGGWERTDRTRLSHWADIAKAHRLHVNALGLLHAINRSRANTLTNAAPNRALRGIAIGLPR